MMSLTRIPGLFARPLVGGVRRFVSRLRQMPASPAGSLLLTDPEVALNPFPHYEALRAGGPVHFFPRHNFWLVVGYDEVQTALTQPQLFSSCVDEWRSVDRVLLGADPPAHTTARRTVVPLFSAQALQGHAAGAAHPRPARRRSTPPPGPT